MRREAKFYLYMTLLVWSGSGLTVTCSCEDQWWGRGALKHFKRQRAVKKKW